MQSSSTLARCSSRASTSRCLPRTPISSRPAFWTRSSSWSCSSSSSSASASESKSRTSTSTIYEASRGSPDWWLRTAQRANRRPRGRLGAPPIEAKRTAALSRSRVEVSSAIRPGGVQWRRTDPAKATIRIFTEDDVPGAAALFARVYPERRWRSQAAYEACLRETLFDNPWREPELPSWVAEEDGRISGFYAVVPRRMILRGRPLRVAMGCQFFVDRYQRH